MQATLIGSITQRVSDRHARLNGAALWQRVSRRALQATRKGILRVADPVVSYQLGDVDVLLPLSHDLPYIRHWAPGYGENFVRIVRALEADAPVIDVGANVGDTVALVRAAGSHPVLCVEGSGEFLPLLTRNAVRLQGVTIEPVFVGPADLSGRLRAQHEKGTATLVEGDAETTVEPLDAILGRHPRFARARLLKSDTDGFDAHVLYSAERLLREVRPVLFFEYFPDVTADPDRLPDVFAYLANLGYRQALVFDSTGSFLIGADLSDAELTADLHVRYRRNRRIQYADICAFHEDDAELAAALRSEERRLAAGR